MAALKTLAAVDQDVEREGHVYAHGIGIEAYQRERSVAKVFGRCSTEFSSGCAHGVIQAYLESQTKVDSTSLTDLCQSYRDPSGTRWLLFQCVHGMGHGLDMLYEHDLPHALESCDLLADGWDRAACYGGAFMENIMHEISPHHPASELAAGHAHHSAFKALDPADPLYPCSIMARKYLQACYQIQTAAILHFTHGDISGAATVCDTAPPDWRPVCYQSLGRDISSYALRDPDKSIALCHQGAERYRPSCYVGVVKALVDWSASSASGMVFCERLGHLDGWLQCYEAVGQQVAVLVATDSERVKLCTEGGRPEAVTACRAGAGVPIAVSYPQTKS